jgi:hypothetical protein
MGVNMETAFDGYGQDGTATDTEIPLGWRCFWFWRSFVVCMTSCIVRCFSLMYAFVYRHLVLD